MKSFNLKQTFNNISFFLLGVGFVLAVQLFTSAGQDIPGTGGLTRVQLAEMLYECDRASRQPEGFCVADVNIRPSEVQE